jgi:hypothetical protein
MLYVDPAAGSIVLQVAFAAIVGGALTVKRWWAAAKQLVGTASKRLRPR